MVKPFQKMEGRSSTSVPFVHTGQTSVECWLSTIHITNQVHKINTSVGFVHILCALLVSCTSTWDGMQSMSMQRLLRMTWPKKPAPGSKVSKICPWFLPRSKKKYWWRIQQKDTTARSVHTQLIAIMISYTISSSTGPKPVMDTTVSTVTIGLLIVGFWNSTYDSMIAILLLILEREIPLLLPLQNL